MTWKLRLEKNEKIEMSQAFCVVFMGFDSAVMVEYKHLSGQPISQVMTFFVL